MAKRRVPLLMPDLGLGPATIRASLWLVDAGQRVTVGDRLLEVVVRGATVDLPAPVSGRLVEVCIDEDDLLVAGQVLAMLEADAESVDEP